MKIQLEYRKGKVEAPKDENVDKGTVVRACAKSSDGEWGHVSTATYMVGLSPADHSGLPMISLVTDPAALYDHEYLYLQLCISHYGIQLMSTT